MALRTEREKIAHLMRRFAFGVTSRELDQLEKKGRAAVVSALINYETTPDAWNNVDPIAIKTPNGGFNIGLISHLFACRLLASQRPLEAKLTLFWHDHFATSSQKVIYPEAMLNHSNVLREYAGGKFISLLTAISKDPAMLFWLDNNENRAGKPNENFAREVMELFTMGVDNGYTEHDVQEAARAFTGWTYGRERNGRPTPLAAPLNDTHFIFHLPTHDDGTKTVFGQTGKLNGDDVLRQLCARPQTPRFLAKKVWEWFAYPDPEPAVVERMAQKFEASGLDIRTLIRAIMESPEFFSDKADRSIIKNPVDFCFSTARALGLDKLQLESALATKGPSGVRPFGLGYQTGRGAGRMGMELLSPPDVNGWPSGAAWISTGSMLERVKWADELFGKGGFIGAALRGKHLELLGSPKTPEGAAQGMLNLLNCDNMQAKLPQLTEAAQKASKGKITNATIQPTMIAVGRLIFGSPEFQFM